jgi:hypothetical protein
MLVQGGQVSMGVTLTVRSGLWSSTGVSALILNRTSALLSIALSVKPIPSPIPSSSVQGCAAVLPLHAVELVHLPLLPQPLDLRPSSSCAKGHLIGWTCAVHTVSLNHEMSRGEVGSCSSWNLCGGAPGCTGWMVVPSWDWYDCDG